MAVKIRLSLTGKRNSRCFRIVAVDESKKRDGSVIEYLGSINPRTNPPSVKYDKARVLDWVEKGATLTPSVKKYIEVS